MQLPALIRLGGWQALLYACTPNAEAPVQRFCDSFRAFLTPPAVSGGGVRHLVIADPSVSSEGVPPTWLLESEGSAWAEFHAAWTDAYRRFSWARSLSATNSSDLFVFSWPRSNWKPESSLGSSPEGEPSSQFFALVLEEPDTKASHLKIFGFSFHLATQWHVARGGLGLHSCAVARGSDGFLFLGDSEAGKTTVARLSASIGYPALGDDLNFVVRDGEAGYRLAAAPSPKLSPVGYSACRPLLRGVFILVQDDGDYFVPLSPLQTARALFDGFIEQTPYVQRLPDEMVGLAFWAACDIAHRIPGYELHFRKSPDFWELIDEQFPD
jgi:hypothetical protein